MAKLKLQPNPTFTAQVAIPVPGSDAVKVSFTFKHRTRDELDAFLGTCDKLKDADLIMSVANGWELADVFNEESLNLLVQNYIGAPHAILQTYLDEMVKARQKN